VAPLTVWREIPCAAPESCPALKKRKSLFYRHFLLFPSSCVHAPREEIPSRNEVHGRLMGAVYLRVPVSRHPHVAFTLVDVPVPKAGLARVIGMNPARRGARAQESRSDKSGRSESLDHLYPKSEGLLPFFPVIGFTFPFVLQLSNFTELLPVL
jgi:hypothetical protein